MTRKAVLTALVATTPIGKLGSGEAAGTKQSLIYNRAGIGIADEFRINGFYRKA